MSITAQRLDYLDVWWLYINKFPLKVPKEKTCSAKTNCIISLDASSVSGQAEPNCALWLATQAGKMELSLMTKIKSDFTV